ncbi:MAG: PLP-dependent aminotransferase family protein, partial [Pseudomonadota bacterium]|nr:PLP-dependent aminotransferase family protein [Pseudomonadota bacterium]
LKSLDAEGRVVYVESLSNTLLPGLHLGFLVGPERLVEEARALRRLMLGDPPAHTARTAGLFLALGQYDGLLRKLERIYHRRREAAGAALSRHLPGAAALLSPGSASAWVKGPEGLDSDRLALTAAERGVALQSGRPYFAAAPQPCNFFRLGFSLIDESRIEPGIRLIADIIGEISTEAS